MYTRVGLLFLFGVSIAITGVRAQSPEDLKRVGWEPLPDSLFLYWNLDKDQVKRIGMIEEDYEAERTKLVVDTSVPEAKRDSRMRTMANARRKEIKGVLKLEHYEDWQERMRSSGGR